MRLNVTDRDGVEHCVDTPATGTLMEALRELDYGVAAICGGMCSCATCHVYVGPEWIGRLPAQQCDEYELVRELQRRRESSRLACQIHLQPAFDGLCVALAADE